MVVGIGAVFRRGWRWPNVLAVAALAGLAGYGTHVAGHFPNVGMFPGYFYGGIFMAFILSGATLLASYVGSYGGTQNGGIRHGGARKSPGPTK